jgi:hypothetical protein
VLSCTVIDGVEVFANTCTVSAPAPVEVKVSEYAPSAAVLLVASTAVPSTTRTTALRTGFWLARAKSSVPLSCAAT